eukprot:SAG31_NODE_2859_length_4990_cov_113.128399_4_plen_91_part_00
MRPLRTRYYKAFAKRTSTPSNLKRTLFADGGTSEQPFNGLAHVADHTLVSDTYGYFKIGTTFSSIMGPRQAAHIEQRLVEQSSAGNEPYR